MRTRLILLLLALAAPIRAAGQDPTPEAAARQYIAAMQAGDWTRTAALTHPDALAELRGFFTTVAAADSTAQLLGPIFGVASAAEFRALPPAEVYARLLRTVTAASPQLAEAMRGMRTEVLGTVAEGDTAHVVYRMQMTMNGANVRRTEVLSLRRSGGAWLALLTGDLEGMARSLSRAVAPR